MSDPHRHIEVTRHSWGRRVGGSLKGVLFGLLLVVIAGGVLFWNEGRAVKRAQALAEGAGAVVEVESMGGGGPGDGALVHMSGEAISDQRLEDPEFGIGIDRAIKLRRVAEVYHWQERQQSETRESVGGSAETTTTYTYERVWSTTPIDSSRFRKSSGHYNPPMAYPGRLYRASEVTVGDHHLSDSLVNAINRYQPLPASAHTTAGFSPPGRPYGSGYYIGNDPASPAIGDQRIHFEWVGPVEVSVVAARSGQRLFPYTTSDGEETIELLEYGRLSAAAMFKQAQDDNSRLTWMVRGGGLIALMIGFVTILRPLRMVAAVIPFLARLTDGAITLVGGLLALVVWLVVVAIAWIFYRPLLAGGLLLAAAALLWLGGRTGGGHHASSDRVNPVPPPPPAPSSPPPPPPPPIP